MERKALLKEPSRGLGRGVGGGGTGFPRPSPKGGADMWQLAEAASEMVLRGGRLFLPLVLDPEIEEEARGPGEERLGPEDETGVLERQGERRFVQGVRLDSLADNYPLLFPDSYENLCRAWQEQYSLTGELWGLTLPPELAVILFHVLPHFVRRRGPDRPRLKDEGEVLDFIREEVEIPPSYHFRTKKFLDTHPLEEALARLQDLPPEPPPPEGLVSGTRLKSWLRKTLKARWLTRERTRLRQALQDREGLRRLQEERLAVLWYVAERKSFEIQGFGFIKLTKGRGYCLYKRTGPFALQDYYGRPYLFPDCRVAVTTQGRLRPVVLESYKHPFLRRQEPNQEICLGTGFPHLLFSAANAVRALEAGLNALFYSYDRRRRNGYHSLDEHPARDRLVHFEDYRVPADHPLLTSGQVEIKNQAT
jgi:hypothetical protein